MVRESEKVQMDLGCTCNRLQAMEEVFTYICGKFLAKGKDVFLAFMNLEKALF